MGGGGGSELGQERQKVYFRSNDLYWSVHMSRTPTELHVSHPHDRRLLRHSSRGCNVLIEGLGQ